VLYLRLLVCALSFPSISQAPDWEFNRLFGRTIGFDSSFVLVFVGLFTISAASKTDRNQANFNQSNLQKNYLLRFLHYDLIVMSCASCSSECLVRNKF
jgi:hypothetical protein